MNGTEIGNKKPEADRGASRKISEEERLDWEEYKVITK
jgi:hypothetical protein